MSREVSRGTETNRRHQRAGVGIGGSLKTAPGGDSKLPLVVADGGAGKTKKLKYV